MKTFLLSALITTIGFSASAQGFPAQHHDNRPPAPDHRYDSRTPGRNDQWALDQRIASINRDYDNRIARLRQVASLRAKERRQQIKLLERDRAVALDQCRNGYSTPYASGYGHPSAKPSVGISVHIGF